jgi:magnesium-transporting ATPase (P-type)
MPQINADRDQHAWHNLSANSVLMELKALSSGLCESEATSRLKIYGTNRLPEPEPIPAWLRFIRQFHNILIYVLLCCAVITVFLSLWADTSIILAVIMVNSIIGFVQEGKAESALTAIRRMLAPRANVLRAGKRIKIESEKLVPGDIILLEAGDKIPADLRLLTSHGLLVQEAILTGESVSVEKNTNPVSIDAPLGDRYCMAFSGTLVTNGQGEGVVVATGSSTELGRISGLLSAVETMTTPLLQQMDIFAKWITILILTIATLLIIYGYFVMHYNFNEIFMMVVGITVAAIPEGLPAVLTITLAIGVQAMAKCNAIVRRLPAIETLGSVSVICTDKTGTLTRNEMMVASVLTPDCLFTLEGTGYEPKGEIRVNNKDFSLTESVVLEELALAAVLCNDAVLREDDGIWLVEGDPMEGALLAFAGKANVDAHKEYTVWKRLDLIPFDAKHSFMATLNHNPDYRGVVFVKGAPERIFAMCKSQRSADGKTQELNTEYWHKNSEKIASLGQRVLAFAVLNLEIDHNLTELQHEDIDGELTLLGIVGMIDPPRAEAITAISECYDAGIRVIMITGDHAKTAAAIGKQIGLRHADTVLTGHDLDRMSEVSLRQAVLNCDIFARTTPEHKLRLVTALQSHNMTVAMTGDGVNDAPALKRADAGIAMGQKGSEVAKEAAELVLTDDNFASIVSAIREGRTVYDNIKKVISWTLPTNAGTSMVIIVALLLGSTLPVTPLQILWINLITSITLGMALAFEPTEENTMRRLPRLRDEPLLGSWLVWHILFVSILFLCGVYGIFSYAIDRGYSMDLARTLVVNTLVVLQIFYLFFIRNIYGTSLTWKAVRGTKVVWITVTTVTLAQFSITYLSPLQKIFATQSVTFFDGLLVVAIGFAVFAIIEIEKQIRLRLRKNYTIKGGTYE